MALISPPFAGLSFQSGTSRFVFPDSFVPIRAVTLSTSIQPLSSTERNLVTRNLRSFIILRNSPTYKKGQAFAYLPSRLYQMGQICLKRNKDVVLTFFTWQKRC